MKTTNNYYIYVTLKREVLLRILGALEHNLSGQQSSKKRARFKCFSRFSSRATIFGNSFLVPRLSSTNHACCGQFPHRKRLVPGTTLLPLFSFWAATHPRSHMVAPKAEETDSSRSKDPSW
ncbi:hypothetical protein DPMN_080633 [Dreissena polymorpha]|uniref:Uncharacterized protein n=1 Tax=Dreissena polymorpha TaxID=45954 RepID=A0A9D4BS21_DREPO|nr:hypothetical protein DPMN_080633 [Dreissena polymorpha]